MAIMIKQYILVALMKVAETGAVNWQTYPRNMIPDGNGRKMAREAVDKIFERRLVEEGADGLVLTAAGEKALDERPKKNMDLG
jgi:hypothetical protein